MGDEYTRVYRFSVFLKNIPLKLYVLNKEERRKKYIIPAVMGFTV